MQLSFRCQLPYLRFVFLLPNDNAALQIMVDVFKVRLPLPNDTVELQQTDVFKVRLPFAK